MSPEEVGRRLLGPVLLARLEVHIAPPLMGDLCRHVAAVARAEREYAAAWLDARAAEWRADARAEAAEIAASLAEGVRTRGTP